MWLVYIRTVFTIILGEKGGEAAGWDYPQEYLVVIKD